MSVQSVLVVDDEKRIVDTLRLYLEKDGLRVVSAYDGPTALELFDREKPDLLVLDLMLPGLSGLDVCRSVRARSTVPIIMLTARAEEMDKILGLELGADDYVTKPFSPREVAARVRAVLRRAGPQANNHEQKLQVGGLSIDVPAHQVRCGEDEISLTPTEFRLLEVLASAPGRVYTRPQLVEAALGYEFDGFDRAIDSHIKNLRKKLVPQGGCRVVTVHGLGYKLEEAAQANPVAEAVQPRRTPTQRKRP
jgi:DNA-binding response OmpR family regulator